MLMRADTSHVVSVVTVLSNVTFKDSRFFPFLAQFATCTHSYKHLYIHTHIHTHTQISQVQLSSLVHDSMIAPLHLSSLQSPDFLVGLWKYETRSTASCRHLPWSVYEDSGRGSEEDRYSWMHSCSRSFQKMDCERTADGEKTWQEKWSELVKVKFGSFCFKLRRKKQVKGQK